ncbi:uncharacterized protein LOC111404469 [Olea europaea var. sylvestris]|uniref:uncharacterized protein LOC111404469 n=1 Tax=Olea europaea var. sylvestris TaxID=158386 RepID=UPI000C1CD445|nr:uncharacterized protein LOC111404469 [Olea europaea var. sylvestris]
MVFEKLQEGLWAQRRSVFCIGPSHEYNLKNFKKAYGHRDESVNAVTKVAKNYLTVSLLESLRKTVQSWFCKHRDDAHGTFTKLSSKYENEMRKISVELRHLRVSPSNQSVFSVSDEKSTFVVDIEQRTCTCRMLQVDLIPCSHALAVIANTRRNPYAYYSYYYTRDAYTNIVPEEVQAKIVLAPNQKRSSGRPIEKRKRSSREGKPTMKCDHCGGQGHNRRRCSSVVPLN